MDSYSSGARKFFMFFVWAGLGLLALRWLASALGDWFYVGATVCAFAFVVKLCGRAWSGRWFDEV